ncbi:MAG: hypothetical protein ACD_29C00310G0003, partial [uncultured bacterium]
LGYAFGQLMYGPIANRFGRKIALYVGLLIAAIGSLISIISSPIHSFGLLIIGRFVEAVGASGGLVVCMAIINDFYFETQARKIMGALMLAFAIMPGLANLIGGTLVQFLGWQSCFYFLFLYGVFLIYFTYRLPETALTHDLGALEYEHIAQNYIKNFQIKKLLGFAAISGFSTACIYVFGIEGPFVAIHFLHLQPAIYGMSAMLPYVGALIGALIMMRLSAFNPLSVIQFAIGIEVTAALLMLTLFIFFQLTLWAMLLPMTLFFIGHPILSGTSLTVSMQQTPDKSNGSAVVNFASMCTPVLMTFTLGILHTSHAWIMPIIFLISLFLMSVTYRKSLK